MTDANHETNIDANVKTSKRVGTSRFQLTSRHLTIITFLALFPCADATAIAQLLTVEHLKTSRSLPEISNKNIHPNTAKKLLANLKRRGYVTVGKSALTAEMLYGVSKQGEQIAASLLPNHQTKQLDGIAITALRHHQMIAYVAAQLLNPTGSTLQEKLQIQPLKLTQLVNENTMRIGVAMANQELKALAKTGITLRFGDLRQQKISKEISQRTMFGTLSTMLTEQPMLWSIGHETDLNLKPIIQPDLAINLDQQRTDSQANNLYIEIELNAKPIENYVEHLKSLRRELANSTIYRRAIYIVADKKIAQQIINADRIADTKLYETGLLKFIQLPPQIATTSKIQLLN